MASQMTSRERMITAMRNQQPDMAPVAPDISNMIPCRLTGKPFWDIYLHKTRRSGKPMWTQSAISRWTAGTCMAA